MLDDDKGYDYRHTLKDGIAQHTQNKGNYGYHYHLGGFGHQKPMAGSWQPLSKVNVEPCLIYVP